MRRLTLAASVLAVFLPSLASAQTDPKEVNNPVNNPTTSHVRQYQRSYYAVVAQFGHRAPGRNIVNWGFAPGQAATDSQVVASLGVLNRMLAPPAPVAPSASTGTSSGLSSSASTRSSSSVSSSGSSSSGSGGWAVPDSVVQCESGGQNLAPNSASASGYYQIISSTWAAYGGTRYAPSAYQASLAQQSAVASKIWAGGSGASQWVCK